MTAVPISDRFLGTGRFVVRRVLGSGAFGMVYEAHDQHHDATVALKVLRGASADALYQFKQEFRQLVDLTHPNLVALYELHSADERWFFTMELIDGVGFLDHVHAFALGTGRDTPSVVSITGAGSSRISRAPFDSVPPSSGPVFGTDADQVLPVPHVDDLAVAATLMHASAPPAHLVVSSTSTLPASGVPVGMQSGPRLVSPPVRDYERLREALYQLAVGLNALHDAGMLHRDIKPSNVMVTRDGRVVLLDFGLVTDVVDPTDIERGLVGTPAYMAPEQALGVRATPASDWYGVGVMLYEALTGRLPFDGTGAHVLVQKQKVDPESPRLHEPKVPVELDALCMDLLSRKSAERPSGADVLERLERLSRGTAGRTGAARLGRAEAHAPPRLRLVGREPHLAALASAFDACGVRGDGSPPRAVTAFVRGLSGMGKSTLVERFLRDLRSRAWESRVVVLGGRCYEQESVPYKALDAVVDALSQWLRRAPEDEVQRLVPVDAAALTRLFPVLGQVAELAAAAGDGAAVPDAGELRSRAIRALRELLVRLGELRPLVIVVDDLQWGDLDSAALLADLLRPPRPPRVLFIASYRQDEADTSAHLRVLLPTLRRMASTELEIRDVEVAELSLAQVSELSAQLTGGATPAQRAQAASLALDARRSPFFLQELIRHVAEGAGPDAGVGSLDDLLWARISRLPDGAQRALYAVCIAGRPTELSVLREVAALGGQELPVVRALRAARLVRGRRDGAAETVEAYHDRIRETVESRLEAQVRADYHRAFARVLEARGDADDDVLARHFGEAGDREKAGHYAEAAAKNAERAFAFARAAGHYRAALEQRTLTPEARGALSLSLADALTHAGRGAEAAAVFVEAATTAPPAVALDLRRRAADQLLRSGFIDEGIGVLRESLDRYGMVMAKSTTHAVASIALRRSWLSVRGVDFLPRAEADVPAEELARVDTCHAVAIGLGMVDYPRGADFQTRHLLLALETGEPFRIARALMLDAAYGAAGGITREARTARFLAKADELIAGIPDPYLLASSFLCRGITVYLLGRFRACFDYCEEAQRIYRTACKGVAWELEGATRHALVSLGQLGELAQLLERTPGTIADAQQRGDAYAETNLRLTVGSFSRLVEDDPEGAREHVAIARDRWVNEGFQTQHYWAEGALADVALYAGDRALAYAQMNGAWVAQTKRTLTPFHQYARVQLTFRRGRAAAAFAVDAKARSATRATRLAEAERCARSLLGEGVPWATAHGHLLIALAETSRGDRAPALEALVRAESSFESVGMRAVATAIRRQLGMLMGGASGKLLVDDADAWMTRQGVRDPERFATLLAPCDPRPPTR